MESATLGAYISQVEVTNVSKHGFWLLLDDEELFLPFTEFPWFKDASIGKLLNVERPRPHHLYWPDLDGDLAVESIRQRAGPIISRAFPTSGISVPRPRGGSKRYDRST
jgi:hypothetical protein